jgi:hypothetical protein
VDVVECGECAHLARFLQARSEGTKGQQNVFVSSIEHL